MLASQISNFFWRFGRLKQLNEKKIHDNFTGGSSILRPPLPCGLITAKIRVSQLWSFYFPISNYQFYFIWIAFSFAFFSDKPFINDSQFFNLELPPRQARISNSNTKIMQENTCHYCVLCFSSSHSHLLYSFLKWPFNIAQQFSAATLAQQSFLRKT